MKCNCWHCVCLQCLYSGVCRNSEFGFFSALATVTTAAMAGLVLWLLWDGGDSVLGFEVERVCLSGEWVCESGFEWVCFSLFFLFSFGGGFFWVFFYLVFL